MKEQLKESKTTTPLNLAIKTDDHATPWYDEVEQALYATMGDIPVADSYHRDSVIPELRKTLSRAIQIITTRKLRTKHLNLTNGDQF